MGKIGPRAKIVLLAFLLMARSSVLFAGCSDPMSKAQAQCIATLFLYHHMTHPYPCFFPGACALGIRDVREWIEEDCLVDLWVVSKPPDAAPADGAPAARTSCNAALAYCDENHDWFVLDHMVSIKPVPYKEWNSTCEKPGQDGCEMDRELPFSQKLLMAEPRYRCYGKLMRDLKRCDGNAGCMKAARDTCECCESKCDSRRRRESSSLGAPRILGLSCQSIEWQPGLCPKLEKK